MNVTLLQLWRRCKVDESDPDSCWIWRGGVNQHGYPLVYTGAKGRGSARRIAWELRNSRRITRGMYCSPKCGEVNCINPEHLELLSRAEYCAGRAGHPRPRDHALRAREGRRRRAKLTLEAVREIRRRAEAGNVEQAELAQAFGVSRSAISLVLRHVIWPEATPWTV